MGQSSKQIIMSSGHLALCAVVVAASVLSAGASRHPPMSVAALMSSSQKRSSRRNSSYAANANVVALFQHPTRTRSSPFNKSSNREQQLVPLNQRIIPSSSSTQLCSGANNDDDTQSNKQSSFLSTSKANVSFTSNTNNNGNAPSNLSPIDQLLVTLTSASTSLLLGSVGIILLLLNRLISFPEDAMYEASRSRIDLLGVFAAGSVLLNGITKLDVESVQADRVALEGVNEENVVWIEGNEANDNAAAGKNENFRSTVEWALASFLKCSPARTAVLLAANPKDDRRWAPLATAGILPSDARLRSAIPVPNTPVLDRMLRDDDGIKGGTVGGTEVAGSATSRKGPKESYLPTLQALPGRVEFTYLPPNAQEALLLPVTRPEGNENDGRYYAVVLGGDTAKSFAPRDIAWCKEIASWIGDCV